MYLSEWYVLAVGLRNRCERLSGLSLRVCSVDTGFQALQQLRLKSPAVLVGLWDLPDMPDGSLFRRLAGAVSVNTVALVRFGDTASEIAARSLGVTVVLDDGVDENTLGELLCQLSATRVATGT